MNAQSSTLAETIYNQDAERNNNDQINPIDFLPYRSDIEFNKERIDLLSDLVLYDLAFHEIGHALGINGAAQSFQLLVDNAEINENNNISNPRFIGENATFWYNQIYNNQETSVPLETEDFKTFEGGQPITIKRGAGHWRERTEPSLGNEIMTPITQIAPGTTNPISKITIGAIEDLGYTVDYSQADEEIPNSIVSTAGESDIDLSDDTAATAPDDSFDEENYFEGNISNNDIVGTSNNDTLYGGGGNDTLDALAGNDFISGDNQDDRLLGGAGNDTLNGGSGNDTVFGQANSDRLDGRSGNDRLLGDLGNDTVAGGVGNDILNGGSGNDTLYGQANNDRVFGLDGNDLLRGDLGNDTITGGAGDDILIGSVGNDSLTGGSGNDRFVFKINSSFNLNTIGTDTITDFGNGIDTISLDKTTFNNLVSEVGSGFSDVNEFAVVSQDSLVANSEAFILYSSGTGKLFYNENGSNPGLGSGGIFATLTGDTSISRVNFALIN